MVNKDIYNQSPHSASCMLLQTRCPAILSNPIKSASYLLWPNFGIYYLVQS